MEAADAAGTQLVAFARERRVAEAREAIAGMGIRVAYWRRPPPSVRRN